MLVIPLQSGSNGNCVYVEAGATRLLVDAGISGRAAEERLAAYGRSIRDVDAVLISHDHADHARCLGIYHRKFGLPVHVTRTTLAAAARRSDLGSIDDVHEFAAGQTIRLGGLSIETIPTPHDGADGVAFVVDDGHRRIGLLTDLGHVFAELADVVRSLNAVLIESNYDPAMLRRGSYPEFLKERIRGPAGHLSNVEAARLVAKTNGRLQWACLGHLSEENNDPDLALDVHRRMVGARGFPIHVASRYHATEPMEV